MKPKWNIRLDSLKKINKTYLIIAALVGILLLVIVIPVDSGKEETPKTTKTGESTSALEQMSSDDAYRKGLERQLKLALGAMDGVGEVEVMITLKDRGEAVVEKDLTRNEEQTKEEDQAGTKRENSVTSSKQETVYAKDGSSDSTPFVAKSINPKVEGVLVVARGADSPVVVKNISDAVLALFPVQAHKIKVVKMN